MTQQNNIVLLSMTFCVILEKVHIRSKNKTFENINSLKHHTTYKELKHWPTTQYCVAIISVTRMLQLSS